MKLPLQKTADSPATAPEKGLIQDVLARWETPRGRYDAVQRKVSLSMKPRFIELVGAATLQKVVGGRTAQHDHQRGTCTQHNQTTLPQRNSEVVNLTGLLKTKN